ncbi:MAG TPA: AsmA-like C-terminal region-containing protein [Kiritimatiellia bacterium]|nr:AsmA-like C-terminal region-containing protein [Kiritimatiellia bacterium]HMP32796.1 AsmA-like C-terminal region-containing protein [Kiritimatiellia bacterium]
MTRSRVTPPRFINPERGPNLLGRLCRSRWIHRLLHILWLGTKVLAVLVFIAWTIGIPGHWLTPRLQPHVEPYRVTVGRITWSPPRGIVLRDIALYDIAFSNAIARVNTCSIRPSYRNLLRGHPTIASIRWSDGTLTLPQPGVDAATPSVHSPSLHQLSGSIIPRSDITLLRIDGATDLGTALRLHARINHGASTASREQPALRWTDHAQRIQRTVYETPAWLGALRERFDAMEHAWPPTLDVVLTHDAHTMPSRTEASIRYQAPPFIYIGVPFDGITMDLALSNSTLRIAECSIHQSTNRLLLTGSLCTTSRIFEAHLHSDLPTTATIPFLPLPWREKALAWGLILDGEMRTEAWIGPAPLTDAPRNWGGWLRVNNARLNTFPIERAFIALKRTSHQLIVDTVRIDGGTGSGKGYLEGSMITDYRERTSGGDCTIGLELRQLDEVLPRGLRLVSHFFTIEESPVTFSGRFETPLDDLDRMIVSGRITGTNGHFRGVPFTGLNVGLVYSNNHVNLDPFQVTCATGAVRGSLHLDLNRDRYGVDLEITTNPGRIAPMGGTNLARHFQPYHFSDDILVRAQGLIDAQDDQATDLAVTLGGRGIGYRMFTFDRLTAQAHRTPGTLAIRNIAGAIYMGVVTGRVDVTLADPVSRFHADVVASNIALDHLIAALADQPTNRHEGRIQIALDIAGHVPEPDGWPSLTGTGTIAIREGRLLRIPLFGGLSTLLQKIYPGLGFSEQNLLEASLRFADGAVHTKDLRLAGSMLSLSAEGSYAWTDNLDFDIKVHPFRDGSIASVVRIVTLPLTYILELSLTGPLRDPRWSAANLPL